MYYKYYILKINKTIWIKDIHHVPEYIVCGINIAQYIIKCENYFISENADLFIS